MSLHSLEYEWAAFSASLFGAIPVPQIQYDEMRKAFFAGASTVCNMMLEIGEESTPEQVGVDHMESIVQECQRFTNALLRRRAENN